MAPSLRGRLTCFYCGCKSAQIRNPTVKRWECEKCQAVNHLDENGEITDPPSAYVFRNSRYAESIPRPASPLFEVPEDSLFCATCIKNQHLYQESLASYFPAEDTPDYNEYERALPAFQKGLEERYPQICEDCEPRVLGRLRATNYAAKTDHLRRIMERTRPGQFLYRQSDWRSFLVFLGGGIWIASWVGQISWDVLGIMNSGTAHDGLAREYTDLIPSVATRLWQAVELSDVAQEWTELAKSAAWYALLLGLLSFWWNPMLQVKLERKRGRIIGKWDFYKLQATSFAIRCAAWAYIASPNSAPDPRTIKTIHYCVLFFGALFTYTSFRAICMDYTPRVSFQDLTPERLVPQPQRTQPVQSGIGQGNPTNVAQTLDMHTPSTYRSGFSINDFTPQTQQPTPAPAPYRPLTPPTDDDGDTAMDWTPSQAPTLPPAPLSRTARSMTQQAQPAPFHGHLPANIVSPAHRLRNPPNQPTFRSATAAQKQNFFEVPNKRSMLDSSSDTSEAGPPSAADLSPMKFADPRFFPDSGNREETGLESLFTNIFSIAEEPAEVRAVQQLLAHNPTPARPASVGFISQWFLPLVLILLVAVGYKLHPIQRVLESTWVREFLAL